MKYKNPVIFFFSLCCLFSNVGVAQEKTARTIIIDPGHGGIDPGTVGQNVKESAIALQVSLKLGAALKKEFPHYKILFTRTTDVLSGNKPNRTESAYFRANYANENKGDLFISIHCNAAGKRPGGWYEEKVTGYTNKVVEKKVNGKIVKQTQRVPVRKKVWVTNDHKGTETYIWAADRNVFKSDAITSAQEKHHESDGFNFDITSPEARIRAQLYEKKFFGKSLQFASLVEEEFVKRGRVSRGVKQRNDQGIWVLQATGMPSVLIELGFLSNTKEEAYLISDKGQAESVAAIIAALKRYFSALDN